MDEKKIYGRLRRTDRRKRWWFQRLRPSVDVVVNAVGRTETGRMCLARRRVSYVFWVCIYFPSIADDECRRLSKQGIQKINNVLLSLEVSIALHSFERHIQFLVKNVLESQNKKTREMTMQASTDRAITATATSSLDEEYQHLQPHAFHLQLPCHHKTAW